MEYVWFVVQCVGVLHVHDPHPSQAHSTVLCFQEKSLLGILLFSWDAPSVQVSVLSLLLLQGYKDAPDTRDTANNKLAAGYIRVSTAMTVLQCSG